MRVEFIGNVAFTMLILCFMRLALNWKQHKSKVEKRLVILLGVIILAQFMLLIIRVQDYFAFKGSS